MLSFLDGRGDSMLDAAVDMLAGKKAFLKYIFKWKNNRKKLNSMHIAYLSLKKTYEDIAE